MSGPFDFGFVRSRRTLQNITESIEAVETRSFVRLFKEVSDSDRANSLVNSSESGDAEKSAPSFRWILH